MTGETVEGISYEDRLGFEGATNDPGNAYSYSWDQAKAGRSREEVAKEFAGFSYRDILLGYALLGYDDAKKFNFSK